MNIKKIGGLCASALLAVAASATLAMASGIWTNGATSIPAATLTGSETLPMDTNYANGASPQSAAVTTSALKTYSNGGAIVTATGSSGASTANGERTIVTTESLTTAAGAIFTETITNSAVTAASLALCSVDNGTNSGGTPDIATVHPGAGSVVVKVQNIHASAAFNGTIVIGCRITS